MDILTVSFIFCVCGYLRDLSLVKYICEYMMRGGFVVGVIVGNILIDVYAKCGDVIVVRDVFKGMECKDIVLWNLLISGYI